MAACVTQFRVWVWLGGVIDVLNLPPPDWSATPAPEAVDRAYELSVRGGALLDEGRLDEAEALLMESIEAVPLEGPPWFNLGLVFKWKKKWAHAAACNRRSIELGADSGDPAYWNLGIAATALHDWATARSAWAGYGIDIDPGDGPIEMILGLTPIRINPSGRSEMCWGRRIDPARAVLENVPLPGSGHRWGDVILHDGAPSGERTVGGHSYPVFDELERWEASPVPTWECLVTGDTGSLVDAVRAAGCALEDWSAGIRTLCRACSEGVPDSHEHGGLPADPAGAHVGAAGPGEVIEALLDEWVSGRPERSRTDLLPVDP
jgi:hypothetical protein